MKIPFVRGLNIHKIYQLFWCEQKRGTIGFDTLPYHAFPHDFQVSNFSNYDWGLQKNKNMNFPGNGQEPGRFLREFTGFCTVSLRFLDPAETRQGFMYILQQEKEERIRREQEEPEGPSLTVYFLILSLGQALTGSFSLILESFDTNEVLYQTDKQVFKAGKGVCRVFFLSTVDVGNLLNMCEETCWGHPKHRHRWKALRSIQH